MSFVGVFKRKPFSLNWIASGKVLCKDRNRMRYLLTNPEVFLERYGPLLNGPLLEALNRWYPDHYEVQPAALGRIPANNLECSLN